MKTKKDFPKVYYVQYSWVDIFEYFIHEENAKKRVEELHDKGFDAYYDELFFEDREGKK